MARKRSRAKGGPPPQEPRGRRLLRIALLLLGFAVIVALLIARTPSPAQVPPEEPPQTGPAPPGPIDTPADALAAPAEAFPEPGDEPLALPRHHRPQPDHRAEYWLFAGRLADDAERAYGFQLAIFRLALQAPEPAPASPWAARDLYRAQLVIDASGEPARAGERYGRAALGLSGAEAAPLRVWLEDWRIELDPESQHFHLRAALHGAEPVAGLDLRVRLPEHAPSALAGPGHRGYWWPGMAAEGTLTLDGEKRRVQGRALLDRLWGRTLPVGGGQLALTRLWLELEDGRALRCRQLRRRGGGGTPAGECLLRAAGGETRPFARGAMTLEPEPAGWWGRSGTGYPLRWTLALDDALASVRIAPLATNGTERPFDLPLWSGAVRANGDVQGWGLLELSNYDTP